MDNNNISRVPAIRAHSISVIFMILFMLSASHILLYDYFGIRLLAQLLFGGAVIVLLGPSVLRQSYAGNYSPLAILCLVYIFIDVIWRQDVKNIAGYAGAFFLIMAVSGFSIFKIEYFSKVIAYILLLFSLAGFAQVAIFFIDPSLSGHIIKGLDSGYYGKINITDPIGWLGNADSITNLFGVGYPRFSSYIEQASALPAYFLLPSAIVLISSIRQRKLAYIPIIFSIASMGGSVIFCLVSSVVMYFICRHLPRLLLVALPFIVFMIFSLIAIFVFSDAAFEDQQFETIEKNNQIEDYAAARANSGFARLTILRDAIAVVVSSPVFGMETGDEKFASLILTSGQRAGFLGIIVAFFAFAMLFKRTASAMHFVRGDAHTSYGLALLYSAAAQAIIYNDYGFSKFWGLTMFAVAYVMLQRLPHLRASAQTRLP